MRLSGLHHVTLVSSDIERTTRFYTEALGLRLVKQTVNYDDPTAKHFYFGEDVGTPGTLVTYFEWPHVPRGTRGAGAVHHYAFTVDAEDDQLRWIARLRRLGIQVTDPRPRRYFTSIYFHDPDGAIVEIATRGPGFLVDEERASLGSEVRVPPPAYLKPTRDVPRPDLERLGYDAETILPSMRLRSLHHVTLIARDVEATTRFYTDLLGMRVVKRTVNFDDPAIPHVYFGDEVGAPGTVVTCFGYPDAAPGRIGVGLAHHFALAVEDRREQESWRARLRHAGVAVTPALDRTYFTSIYFHDPDGAIVEIATRGPGFLVDEPRETLGTRLVLPPGVAAPR